MAVVVDSLSARRGPCRWVAGLLLALWLMGIIPWAWGQPSAGDWAHARFNPKPLPDDVLLPQPCGGAMAFRWVPSPPPEESYPVAGPFVMEDGRPGLLVGKYEVTRFQARAVGAWADGGTCPQPDAEADLPQVLSWSEAVTLAHQMSLWLRSVADQFPDCGRDATACLPRVDGVPAFVRLPLEAEWEYAARGGLAVDRAAFSAPRYPMAEGIDAHAWHRGNADGELQPIGTREASLLGLHDVYGNAAELMLESYRPSGSERRTGAAVVRGGSVGVSTDTLSAGYRKQVGMVAQDEARTTGLRLVAGVPIYTTPDKLREAERRAPSAGGAPGAPVPPPEPVRFVGNMCVRVNVEAEVSLDGRPAGRATPAVPLEIEGVGIGEHRIEVSSEGYKPVVRTQQVLTNRWRAMTITLEQEVESTAPEQAVESTAPEQVVESTAPEQVVEFVAPEMALIEGGCFQMGSPESEPDRDSDEGPQHRVCVEAFEIGKYEVTFDEYDHFARATDRKLPSDQGWGRGKRPVINVSWNDAVAYVEWLSEQTGKAYRLPTEAEWEYAARAGTTTPFWTGRCIHTDQANYNGRVDYDNCGAKTGHYRRKTVEVGSLPANLWGLHEVHGNVWEWVQDGYHSDYRSAPTDGSAWETGGSGRVVRGGAWFNKPRLVRSAIRDGNPPVDRFNSLGFRLARTLTH